jgi:hypothetical protein
MPESLYDTDILSWSEQQAARLRRLASGERVNDVDWPHVIEEIEALGRSELNGVRSHLELALLHALKLLAWPGHRAGDHWRHEIANFLLRARSGYQPGMRQHLDGAVLYRSARRALDKLTMDGLRPGSVPESAELDVQALLDDGLGADGLLALLRGGD